MSDEKKLAISSFLNKTSYSADDIVELIKSDWKIENNIVSFPEKKAFGGRFIQDVIKSNGNSVIVENSEKKIYGDDISIKHVIHEYTNEGIEMKQILDRESFWNGKNTRESILATRGSIDKESVISKKIDEKGTREEAFVANLAERGEIADLECWSIESLDYKEVPLYPNLENAENKEKQSKKVDLKIKQSKYSYAIQRYLENNDRDLV